VFVQRKPPISSTISFTGNIFLTLGEGNSGSTAFTYTLNRTGDLSGIVGVNWMVSPTGVDGADFVGGGLPTGLVTFAAGQFSASFVVNVAGDTVI